MRFFRLALLAILFNWSALKTSAQEAPSFKEWGPQFNAPGAQLAVKELFIHIFRFTISQGLRSTGFGHGS